MFCCRKCGEPLYVRSAEMHDMILTMDVQCLKGHKGVRRASEHQAQGMASEIFGRMFVCLECGLNMTLVDTQTVGQKVYSVFLCPVHGPQKREYPAAFIPTIGLAGAEIDSPKSVLESFRCSTCGQPHAIGDIAERHAILEMQVRCSNGHKTVRYVPTSVESSLMKGVLQRLVNCEICGLPGTVSGTEERRDITRVSTSCPVHGVTKKDVPSSLVPALKEAVSEIPEDAVLKAMLMSRDCTHSLVIRAIEEDVAGYRFRCVCPPDGQLTDRVLALTWSDSIKDRVTAGLLSCSECGLLTHILRARKARDKVHFEIVCPVHGVQERFVPADVFDYVRKRASEMDHEPSIVRSFMCQKCNMPLFLRDVEDRRGLIEFELDCRNGHRTKRLFVPGLDQKTLIEVYEHLYQCPECYEPLDLVYIKAQGRESRVVLLCTLHGKYIFDVPHDHAEAMRGAFNEIQARKTQPPTEVAKSAAEVAVEEGQESNDEIAEEVKAARGCEIIGGKFDYKVKVENRSGYVITNVTVSIVAYPQDCMELAGESVKSISRIEVGGFRSPQFTLYPTKDCVQGKVVATVSYIDFRDQLHTLQVEPIIIRSVCDLLKPSEKTSKDFDLILAGLTKTDQEQTLEWNARILFTKAEKLLPAKNFHIVDKEEHVMAGDFIGTIRGYAEGKYTQKKVAVVFLITGPESGRHAQVKVEALGDDIAMLPTTIDELAETMDSWICLRCGGPLDSDQVEEMEQRNPICCRYCSHTLTLGLYLQ